MRDEGCARGGAPRDPRRSTRARTVQIDRERGQVSAMTRADTLEVTAALTKAGYNATAMTG